MKGSLPQSETHPAEETGTVTIWDRTFGRIQPARGGGTVFFHYSVIRSPDPFRELPPGTRVVFVRGVDAAGRPCAVRVEPAE
jgi:cold shock CspA family protein